MNEDNTLIIAVVRTIAAGIVLVILGMAGCVANTHRQISKDLHAGIDPLLVACAHGTDNSSTACIITAAKK